MLAACQAVCPDILYVKDFSPNPRPHLILCPILLDRLFKHEHMIQINLRTQFEASDEPQLHLVAQSSSATSFAVEVSVSLATNLRDNPPSDLGMFQEAIQQHVPVTASSLERAFASSTPLSFLALSAHELPHACYVAMLWDALSGHKPWAVGCA
eukprot:1150858-Pelagomonas_calceolata.AAC.3